MKIIEKKCPNCGASLEFKIGDKETKCKYCNSNFIIEDNNKDDKDFDINNINLKFAKTAFIIHFIIAGIIILVVLLTIVFMIINMSKSFSDTKKGLDFDIFEDTEEKKASEEKQSLDEITADLDEKLSKEALNNLGTWTGYLTTYKIQGDYEKVGYYYLKNSVSVKIVYVYKTTYSNGSESKEVYKAVSFVGLSLDGLGQTAFVDTNKYNLNDNEYAYGYESIEDLYNKVIKSTKSFNFKVLATDGLYIEK